MKTWMKWVTAGLALVLVIGVVFFVAQTPPIVKKKTITLTVVAQEGTFTINAVDALQVKAGENVGFTISCTPSLGFNRPVKFTVAGGPSGMQVAWTDNDDTWDPGQQNIQCNLVVPLDNGLVGAYPIELTGTSQ